MRKIKRLFAAAALSLGVATGANAAIIPTDIVFIVDESGSMGDVQANLRTNIGNFASILAAGGLDARYALVGYGNSAIVPRLITDFTNATDFATAAQGLVASGGTEPGYTATAFALNGLDDQTTLLSYRTAVKNLIILTDEPSNGDLCTTTSSSRGCIGNATPNATNVDALIKENNALLNAVLSSFPTGSTVTSYGALATGNGGDVYNLALFGSSNQAEVQAFVTAFATAKLQETLDFCALNPNDPACQSSSVPEPGTLALVGLVFAGLGFSRRRKLH